MFVRDRRDCLGAARTDKYEQAETVLRMRRSAGGYLGAEFRSATTNAIVRRLEEAQAEAEVRCF